MSPSLVFNTGKKQYPDTLPNAQQVSPLSNRKSRTLDLNNQTSGDDDANSSTDSSSEDENGCGGLGGKNISLMKMSSIRSDMTESNKSSLHGTTGPHTDIVHRTDRATKRRCIEDNDSDTAELSSSITEKFKKSRQQFNKY